MVMTFMMFAYHPLMLLQVMRWKKQLSPSLTIDLPLDLQVKVLCAQGALYTRQKKLNKAKVSAVLYDTYVICTIFSSSCSE